MASVKLARVAWAAFCTGQCRQIFIAAEQVASQPPQKRQRTKDRLQKRDGVEPAVIEVRNAIITAAKTEDAALAIQAFDRAIAEGMHLLHHLDLDIIMQ